MSLAMNFTIYAKLARLHRPVGIWLLLFPSWWGIALASSHQPPPFLLLLLFACGALFMRSAGCIYNDIIDQDFDRQVRRTASRPLAANEVSLKEAINVLVFFLAGGALILFSLSFPVIIVGFIALGLVFLYPWMKRITYWPQLFLGVTFSMGVLMGWLSLCSTLSLVPLFFYAGGILWTLGYDTIYAFQDKEDDLLIGVKSLTFIASASPKSFIGFVYGLTLIFWGTGGILAQVSWVYWLFLGVIALQFSWQAVSLEEKNSTNCLKRFKSNASIGFLLFLAIVFSRLID